MVSTMGIMNHRIIVLLTVSTVSLIKDKPMILQKSLQFLFRSYFLMMLFLIFYIIKNLFELRLAYRKCGKTCLPQKFMLCNILFINIMRRRTFYAFKYFGHWY